MPSPEKQLHDAWEAGELTLRELRDRSGLTITIVSLSRKLRGLQPLSTDECAALARVLGVQVTIGRKRAVA